MKDCSTKLFAFFFSWRNEEWWWYNYNNNKHKNSGSEWSESSKANTHTYIQHCHCGRKCVKCCHNILLSKWSNWEENIKQSILLYLGFYFSGQDSPSFFTSFEWDEPKQKFCTFLKIQNWNFVKQSESNMLSNTPPNKRFLMSVLFCVHDGNVVFNTFSMQVIHRIII